MMDMTPEQFLEIWKPQTVSEHVAYDMIRQLIESKALEVELNHRLRRLTLTNISEYSRAFFLGSRSISIEVRVNIDGRKGTRLQVLEIKDSVCHVMREVSQAEAHEYSQNPKYTDTMFKGRHKTEDEI